MQVKRDWGESQWAKFSLPQEKKIGCFGKGLKIYIESGHQRSVITHCCSLETAKVVLYTKNINQFQTH
jgi:hypothetical protein